MQLIPKQEMMKLNTWKTFERYPKQNKTIVLHIRGYCFRENKNVHDFLVLPNFDATKFNPRQYVPKQGMTTWNYSWLPITNLMKQ